MKNRNRKRSVLNALIGNLNSDPGRLEREAVKAENRRRVKVIKQKHKLEKTLQPKPESKKTVKI